MPQTVMMVGMESTGEEVDWEIRDFDPEDEAPKGDPEQDCTGEGDRHDGR